MHDNGIGYGSVNHPVDRDPVCGYTGIGQMEYVQNVVEVKLHKRHVILKRMRDNCCSATSI